MLLRPVIVIASSVQVVYHTFRLVSFQSYFDLSFQHGILMRAIPLLIVAIAISSLQVSFHEYRLVSSQFCFVSVSSLSFRLPALLILRPTDQPF